MSNVIKQIQDKEGNNVFPVTQLKAIYDKNGERMDNVIPKMVDVNGGETADAPRDADTLGGEYSAADITEMKENVTTLNDSLNRLDTNLSFPDGVGFYPDIQDGKRGYNTDAARGADTFIPFRQPIVGASAIYSAHGGGYPGTYLLTQGFKYITITNDIPTSSSSSHDLLYLYGTSENEETLSSGNNMIGTNLGQIVRASTVTFDISNYTAIRIVNSVGSGYCIFCHFKLHD